MAQVVKHLPTMQEIWIQPLGQEDLLKKEMATHSSILAWKIPWVEEPGRLQSMWWQRVGHNWATSLTPQQHLGLSLFCILAIQIGIQTYHTMALISHASKLMLIILHDSIQQYVKHEIPDVQAGFRKDRGTRDQIANIRWISKKARVPEKYLLLLYWLCQSLWLCGSPQTVENS